MRFLALLLVVLAGCQTQEQYEAERAYHCPPARTIGECETYCANDGLAVFTWQPNTAICWNEHYGNCVCKGRE